MNSQKLARNIEILLNNVTEWFKNYTIFITSAVALSIFIFIWVS